MPFEMSGGFRLISEHIATRDFSRVRCGNNEKQPPAALAAASQIQPVSNARISDIGQQRKAFGDPLDAWSDLECPLRRVRRSRILPFGQRIAPTHHGLARDMTAAYYASVPIRCTNAPWIDHGPRGRTHLKHSPGKNLFHRSMCTCCEMNGTFRADATSRRGFLTAGAALAAGAAAAPLLTMPVQAQGGDPELSRLQSQRRIVLKGGVVLTLDRQVGDFAQADLLIEDGKIREIRPNIAVSTDAAAVVDASNRIIIPGFIDTHSHSYQGLVRNILANGLLNPDYNRDIQTTLTPVYSADDAYAGVLLSALGFIEMGTTAIVDISQCSHTPEHSRCHDPRAERGGHPRGLFLSPRRRRQASVSAGHQAAAEDLFQLQGPTADTGAHRQSQRERLFARARRRRADRAASRRQRPQQAGHRSAAGRPDAAGRRIHPLHRDQR